MSVYWSHFPAGTSAKEIAHYAQMVRTGKDVMYDYGSSGNMEHYNQTTPPIYNISLIPKTIPIALFSGTQDRLADPIDVKSLTQALGNKVVYNNIQDSFTHMDFTWGLLSQSTIYPKVVGLIQKYSQQQ